MSKIRLRDNERIEGKNDTDTKQTLEWFIRKAEELCGKRTCMAEEGSSESSESSSEVSASSPTQFIEGNKKESNYYSPEVDCPFIVNNKCSLCNLLYRNKKYLKNMIQFFNQEARKR